MKTFELSIFIDCISDEIYDHLSEPINMLGLQPLLTEIDVLKAGVDENGIAIRPFYTVETFRLFGLPVFRNRIYSVIHLTKPKAELEYHVFRKPGIEIIFSYRFRQLNDDRTQVSQTVHFVKANKLLENFVINRAKHAQKVLLSNLKVRLEKH